MVSAFTNADASRILKAKWTFKLHFILFALLKTLFLSFLP
jgi:hypothetical protein